MSRPADQLGQNSQTQSETAKPLRFVTAASLFDGHDAAINIMRRLIQAQGAEVIHLGHNRSVLEIVRAAIQEDADAIAISSYQGGHNEYFRYMIDLLKERGAQHIRVFGGGGGRGGGQGNRDPEGFQERPGETEAGRGGGNAQVDEISELIVPGQGRRALRRMFAGGGEAGLVDPGDYTVTLTAGDRTFTQTLRVERIGTYGTTSPSQR